MISPSIRSTADAYSVDAHKLFLLTQKCPVYDPSEGTGFELSELAQLLNRLGEDVDRAANRAHAFDREFGFIPTDSSCVSDGMGTIYFDIEAGSFD